MSSLKHHMISLFRSFIVLLLATVVIPCCKPRQSIDAERIETLRVQAEELVKAQSLMGWNSWVFGRSSNQDSLYKMHADLFTKENIKLVRRAEVEEPDTVQKKRLRYFRRYLTAEFLAKSVAPLTDRVSNMESAAKIIVDGKEIPYRDANGLIANEAKQERRARLYTALDQVLDSLNLVYVQIERINQQLARGLDYSTYNAMAEEIKELSLDAFKQTAEYVLAATDSLYSGLLGEMLAHHLKLTRGRFHRYDIAPLFRSKQFDRYFPSSSMMDAVKKTYDGLGIEIDKQRNLKIDSTNLPAKNPRAVCYSIDVPNDVRLSIKPIGGVDDYAALFHEMGHGQHYANTRENAFEFKYLGEGTVTESFAFLSEYLLTNQAWLRLQTSMPTNVLKDFVRFQAFYRLYYVRRYCAKFLYELELHSGAKSPQTKYADLQSEAIGFTRIPSDEKRYLADIDAHYYSASYLRAWFLEAQLNATLTKEFGANWFEHPRAGERLRSLWGNGDRLNGSELSTLLGYDSIQPQPLITEIQSMILFSTK